MGWAFPFGAITTGPLGGSLQSHMHFMLQTVYKYTIGGILVAILPVPLQLPLTAGILSGVLSLLYCNVEEQLKHVADVFVLLVSLCSCSVLSI